MVSQLRPKPHSYRIEHPENEAQPACMTEFEAKDAASALFRLQKLLPRGGSVFMYEDGRSLGRVDLDSFGFWTVSARS